MRAARPVTFRTPGTNTPNRSHTNIMSAVTMTSIVAPTAKVSAAPRVGPASRSDDQLQGTFVSRSLPCDFATPRSRRPACARLRDPRPSLTLNHPRSNPNSRPPASRATAPARPGAPSRPPKAAGRASPRGASPSRSGRRACRPSGRVTAAAAARRARPRRPWRGRPLVSLFFSIRGLTRRQRYYVDGVRGRRSP